MGTFSTLVAQVDMLKKGNESTFNGMADVDIQAEYIDAARHTLKSDLCRALSLDYQSAESTLDTLLDTYSGIMVQLQWALAFQQLYQYYEANNDGEGSLSYLKLFKYQSDYNREAKNFARILDRGDGIIRAQRVKL